MTDEQKRKYHTIICEAWELMKPSLDKIYYEEFVAEVHKLSLKYEGKPEFQFASDIICACMAELDRIHGVYGDQQK